MLFVESEKAVLSEDDEKELKVTLVTCLNNSARTECGKFECKVLQTLEIFDRTLFETR